MLFPTQPHTSYKKKFKKGPNSVRRKMLMKDLTHYFVDQIWNHREYCTRADVYVYISMFIGKSENGSHISKLTVKKCKDVIGWAVDILNEGRKLDKEYKNEHYDLVTIPSYDFLKNYQD